MPLQYNVNVLQALARHLGVRAREISLSHELRRDWGMTSLSLVLVLLDLEQTVALELPPQELEQVRTVADLVSKLRHWVGVSEQRVNAAPRLRARGARQIQSERRLRRELHHLRWLEQSRGASR